MLQEVLLLGHHLRRQEKASKPSWRPNLCQVRVQEQLVVKRMDRSHMDSVFDDPYIDGKMTSQNNQWIWFEVQIQPESIGIVKTTLTFRIFQVAMSPSFGLFGPYNMLGLLRDTNRGPWMPLRLYNQQPLSTLGFSFALDQSVFEQSPLSVCETQYSSA